METEGPIKRRVTGNSATLTLPSHEESCVVYPIGNEEVVRNAMQENRATILNQFVFGNNKRDLSVRSQRQHCKVPSYWLYRDDAAGTQADICSAQLFAVSGVATHPVIVDNHHIGFSYEDENAFHCRLGGVLSSDVHASRTQQTLSVMKRLEQALMQCGMQFSDIVRTWFYLDELLDWYDEFNVARTGFFRDSSILDRVLPASTGIGLANTAGYALCAGLIAIRPKNRKIQIQEISSPMQCSACTYRSSFSRAVEVEFPTHRSLYISGTASIDSEGGTVYRGDAVRQIEQTMKVVTALLKSRGMGWEDAFRGIVYYTHPRFPGLFSDHCREHGIPVFPIAFAYSDVCRRDLEFEIEMDAVKAT